METHFLQRALGQLAPGLQGVCWAEGYAGSGCPPTWDRGAPSKAGSILGALRPSVHFQHSGKVPKAEGRGFWARAEGLAMTWASGAGLGSGAEVLVSMEAPLPGLLFRSLSAPSSAGHGFRGHLPPRVLRPPGAAGTSPAGSLLSLGWEPPPPVPSTPRLPVPCGWGLFQLQAPAVHPDGARPGPQPRPTQRPHGGDAQAWLW